MLTVSRGSTEFASNSFEDYAAKISGDIMDSDEDEAKYVQRIRDFVQAEKDISDSSSDEEDQESSKDDDDSQGKSSGDRLEPENPRVDATESRSNTAENTNNSTKKIERFVNDTGAEGDSAENPSENPAACLEKATLPNVAVRRRKPGPLRRRLRLMCKLNLSKIDVSAIRAKMKAGNSTRVVSSVAKSSVPFAPLPQTTEETDEENYLLDEEKILGIFQDERILGAANLDENSGRVEKTPDCRDLTRLLPKDSETRNDKKALEKRGAENASFEEIPKTSAENRKKSTENSSKSPEKSRDSSSTWSPSCRRPVPEKSQNRTGKSGIVFSKESPPLVKIRHEKKYDFVSKSEKALSKLSPKKSSKESREDTFKSTTRSEENFGSVSKFENGFKSPGSSKSQNGLKTPTDPEKKTDGPKKSENGPVDRKKLLKGPKCRQSLIKSSLSKRPGPACSKIETMKRLKRSPVRSSSTSVAMFVEESRKSLTRIPLTQEAIRARSQTKGSGLRRSPDKKLSSKGTADAAVYDRTSRPVLKETVTETNSPLVAFSPKHEKAPSRPQSRNSGKNENIPSSPSTHRNIPRRNAIQLSPRRENNGACSPVKKSRAHSENILDYSSNIWRSNSASGLYIRPEISPSNNSVPVSSKSSRAPPLLSELATRRKVGTPFDVSRVQENPSDCNSQSEEISAKLGLPDYEEPVYINWNHSNVPSVVRPEGLSLCKELLSFYQKDIGVNESIAYQLGKVILSETSKMRSSPESPLSERLSNIQIPSTYLPKEVLSEIDSVLNSD